MQKKTIAARPLLAVLGAILSVQIGASIAKELFPLLGAPVTAMIRIGLSALILLAVNRPGLRLTPVQWKVVIPYGLCLGAMNLVFYMALARVPLGIAVTFEFIGPLLLVVFSSKRVVEFLWILLAGGGIALMAPWNNKIDLLGAGMALLAGAFWAGYIVLGRRVSAVLDGKRAVSIGMFFSLLVALPFALGSGVNVPFNSHMVIPAIALAVFCSAVPFSLEIYALKSIPTKTFGILMSIEPAVAAICGVIFLKEYLTVQEYIAVILVVTASVGATLGSRSSIAAVPEV